MSVIILIVLVPLISSQEPLKIIMSDEYSSESREKENAIPLFSPEQYRSDSYRNWYNTNFDKLNKIQDGNSVYKNVPKIRKYSSHPFSDNYSRSSANGLSRSPTTNVELYRDVGPVSTRSRHRKATAQDLKNLPVVLQHAMRHDNSVVHYHEHEHIHKHKKVPMNQHRVPARLKHDNNGISAHLDQTFESTKNYYHQRDNPVKYGSRTRNKHNHHVSHESSSEENDYRSGFGQKQHHKLKRGDLHNRHRRQPPWRSGSRGYRSRG